MFQCSVFSVQCSAFQCHAILKMSPIRPNITICSSNFDRFSNGLGENNMRNLHYGVGIPSRTADRMLT